MAGLNSIIMQIGLKSVSREHKKIIWSDKLGQLKQQSIDIHALWKMIWKSRDGLVNKERLSVKGLYKAAS